MNGHGPAPENAYFVNQWPRLPAAGDHLDKWLQGHQECRLVIIDALQKIRPRSGRYEGVYERDYSDIGELQSIANQHRLAIVLVHHERKADSPDDYDRVSGSAGITGAADCVMILERKDRSVMQGTLIISGRDISDRKYALLWDERFGLWSYEGTPAEVEGRKARDAILEAMGRLGRPCGQTEIGQLCGKSRQAVQKQINRLLEDGVIEAAAGQPGKYRLCPDYGGYPESWDKP